MRFNVDGKVFNTDSASQKFERVMKAGDRHFSNLYKSRKGQWYFVHLSCVDGEIDTIELVSPKEAATLLLANGDPLPSELSQYAEEIEE